MLRNRPRESYTPRRKRALTGKDSGSGKTFEGAAKSAVFSRYMLR